MKLWYHVLYSLCRDLHVSPETTFLNVQCHYQENVSLSVQETKDISNMQMVRRFLLQNGGLDWLLGDEIGYDLMQLWLEKLVGSRWTFDAD